MEYFDDKQRKLIKSWHNLSEKSEDYYMAFMSEWIAFNAICYNLYYEKSVMERASIDRNKSKLSRIEKKLAQSVNIFEIERKSLSGKRISKFHEFLFDSITALGRYIYEKHFLLKRFLT